MGSTNTTGTVTHRRKGWIGRVRTGAGRAYEYWQAVLRVDGKAMWKTSKDRAVVEAWLRDRLGEHPTYTLPLRLRGYERRRKGSIRSYETKRGGTRWQVLVTVDGRCYRRSFADRADADAWLRDRLGEHPTYLSGPRGRVTPLPVEVTPVEVTPVETVPVETVPVEVEVGTSPVEDTEVLMAALPSVHIKWRPDLGLELVRGHDPADVRRALGWDAARTRRALDLLVEKGRMVVHVTKWGPLYRPVSGDVAARLEMHRERAIKRENMKRLYDNG